MEIARIKKAGRNSNFLNRVFTKEELRYASSSQKKWERLAVRFAAKEATWKALGASKITLNNISIGRLASGKPVINLQSLGFPKTWKASISLTHSDNYAVAHCLVYEENNRRNS